MKTLKDLGFWMDNITARLMEYAADPIINKTVDSKFTHQEKEDSLDKSESLINNKEQH